MSLLGQPTGTHPLTGDAATADAVEKRFLQAFLLAAVLPFILLGLFLLINHLADPKNALRLFQVLPISFIPFGSEASIAWLVHHKLPFLLIVAFLLISDMATSLPFIALTKIAHKTPLLGRYILRVQTRGAAMYTKYAWLRRLGVVGLGLFVALPLAGTGTTVGILIGRAGGIPSIVVAGYAFIGSLVRWVILVGAVSGVAMVL